MALVPASSHFPIPSQWTVGASQGDLTIGDALGSVGIQGDGDPGIFLDTLSTGAYAWLTSNDGLEIQAKPAATRAMYVKTAAGGVMLLLTETGAITFLLSNGAGQAVFQVDADGDLHGKTGRTLAFDL